MSAVSICNTKKSIWNYKKCQSRRETTGVGGSWEARGETVSGSKEEKWNRWTLISGFPFFENQLKTNLMSGQASPPPLPSSPPPRDSPPPTSSSNPTPGTARLDMLLGESNIWFDELVGCTEGSNLFRSMLYFPFQGMEALERKVRPSVCLSCPLWRAERRERRRRRRRATRSWRRGRRVSTGRSKTQMWVLCFPFPFGCGFLFLSWLKVSPPPSLLSTLTIWRGTWWWTCPSAALLDTTFPFTIPQSSGFLAKFSAAG